MEKKQKIQSHGGGKVRKMKLEYPRFWKKLLELLRGKVRKMKLEYPRFWKKLLELLRLDLDRVSSTVAQFFGLDLKPKLSLGVKSARVGIKLIQKKARGFVTARRELTSVVSESGLGPSSISDPGTVSNLGTGLDAVLDLGSDPGTDSLPFLFPVTSVASTAANQEKILANQTVINPQVHSHEDLGRGPAMSKPLNFYFRKSKAKRGPKVFVSAAAEEWLSGTLGLTSMPAPVAQEAVALENVDAGWWKRKEAGLVLDAGSAGSGFSLPQSSPEVGSPKGRVPPKLSLEDFTPKTLIQYKHKCKDMRKPKLVVGQGEHADVGFLRWGFLKSSLSSPSLADRGDSALSHISSSLLDAPLVVEAAGDVQSFSPLEWSLLCSMVGFGSKGQEDKIVAFLSALDEVTFGRISLWVESFRGLGVWIVGCSLGRVAVEVFVSRILSVLGTPYAVIYNICA
jgi:hypothetical protein